MKPPQQYWKSLHEQAQQHQNVTAYLVPDIDLVALSDKDFHSIAQRIIKPLIKAAAWGEVFGLNMDTKAYASISSRLKRDKGRIFLNLENCSEVDTVEFWRTSERGCGNVLLCCDSTAINWEVICQSMWYPNVLTNPQVRFAPTFLRRIRATTLDEKHVCFAFYGADRLKQIIMFFAGRALDCGVQAAEKNCRWDNI